MQESEDGRAELLSGAVNLNNENGGSRSVDTTYIRSIEGILRITGMVSS